ncbi:transposase [Adlercreutzia sp. R7]|uniref:Transposase n=1 Tax=Adlercreutzia wanghongyangiae TaxID=3111451 RepID=A0ABU6IH31_9ACTN|nr:transposase [Adlercreutzia sp. R7]
MEKLLPCEKHIRIKSDLDYRSPMQYRRDCIDCWTSDHADGRQPPAEICARVWTVPHHRRLRTNNVQERANREPIRRSCVVQALPSRKSLIRLLGVVFSEMDEDWASRRWCTEESITLVSSPARSAAPAAAYEDAPGEHAGRIIEVVVADNPIAGEGRLDDGLECKQDSRCLRQQSWALP